MLNYIKIGHNNIITIIIYKVLTMCQSLDIKTLSLLMAHKQSRGFSTCSWQNEASGQFVKVTLYMVNDRVLFTWLPSLFSPHHCSVTRTTVKLVGWQWFIDISYLIQLPVNSLRVRSISDSSSFKVNIQLKNI